MSNGPTTWWHDWAMACAWEIPLSRLRGLPSAIQPVEVRPGVGVFLLNATHYIEGNVEGVPAHYEVALNILCHPDLGIDRPVPRFTFYTPRITSTSGAFLQHARDVDHFEPYFPRNLRVERDPDADRVTFADDDGLIAALWATHPAPRFETATLHGQYYSQRGERLYHGYFQWAGTMFEHQRPERCAEIGWEHPVFQGFDGRGIDEQTYLQMLGPPGELHGTVFGTLGSID